MIVFAATSRQHRGETGLMEAELTGEGKADDATGVTEAASELAPSEMPEILDGRRGRWLRYAVLAANVVLAVVSGSGMLLWALVDNWNVNITAPIFTFVFMSLSVLTYGPTLVAVVVAAWGPHHVAARPLYLLMLSLTYATCSAIGAWWDDGMRQIPVAFLLYTLMSWLNLAVPAALTLAWMGSLRRLRLGPPALPAIRVTIISIMACTGLLSLLIVGVSAANEIFANASAGNVSISPGSSQRGQVLWNALVFGTLVGIVAYIGAASAYRWSARIVALILVALLSGLVVAFYGEVAVQVGGSTSYILWAFSVPMLFVMFWTAISVRLLARSGWELSRR